MWRSLSRHRTRQQAGKVSRYCLTTLLEDAGVGNMLTADHGSSVTTPRRIKVGGVAFYRSKNGNYWRRGVVAASKSKSSLLYGKLTPRSCQDKKDKLCRYFTKTGTQNNIYLLVSNILTVIGSCAKGQSCRYIHDPDKLALCPLYLKDT